MLWGILGPVAGIEPATSWLQIRRSAELSYTGVLSAGCLRNVVWGAVPGSIWSTPGKRSTRDKIAVNHGERPHGDRLCRRGGLCCCGAFHLAKILGRASQRHDSHVVVALEATVNFFLRMVRGSGIEPDPSWSKHEVLTSGPPSGWGGVGRTRDTRLQKPLLYQLSYTPRRTCHGRRRGVLPSRS